MNNLDLLWDDFREHFSFKKDEYIKIADFCNRNCKEMRDIILQTADELTENTFLFRLRIYFSIKQAQVLYMFGTGILD